MRFHAGGDVQVPRRPAHGAGVALPRDSQPRAGLRPGGMRTSTVSVRAMPLAAAGGARIAKLARSAALRAARLNRIAPAICDDMAAPVAFRAGRRLPPGRSLPPQACIPPAARPSAAPGCPGWPARNRCSATYSRSSPFSGACCARFPARRRTARTNRGSRPRCRSGRPRAVRRRARLAGRNPRNRTCRNPCRAAAAASGARATRRNRMRIETVLVVHLALLRIAQNVIGSLDFLEPLLGGLIARIQVRMVLARQPAIRLPDLVRLAPRPPPASRSSPAWKPDIRG